MNIKEIFLWSLIGGLTAGFMLVSLFTAFTWAYPIAWAICVGICALVLKPRKKYRNGEVE